jgi:uncharacterized protein (UPF0332 family)
MLELSLTEQEWREIGQKAIEHFLNDWVVPLAKKRQEAGELGVLLRIHAAQIIFFPDERPIQLRVNEEVKAQAQAVYKPGIEKQVGEPVFEHELERLEAVQLTGEDDPDCGHVTLLLFNNVWHLYFDFRRNQSLARKQIKAAQEFFYLAEFAFERKLWRAFVDVLFSAAELAAKAELLLMPDPGIRKSKKHQYLQAQYNRFARQRDVETSHLKAFNQLAQLRPSARYPKDDFFLSEEKAHDLLINVKGMIEATISKSE